MGHEPKLCVAAAGNGTVARFAQARLAQSAERKALNLVVVGSSPTVGVFPLVAYLPSARSRQSCNGALEKQTAWTWQAPGQPYG